MDRLSFDDEMILDVLREQGLLTDSQEARVRSAAKRGMTLTEAIQKTPLVDPVKFTMMVALVTQRKGDQPLKAQEPTSAQEQTAEKLPDFVPISADDEDVSLEIDEEIPDEIELDGEMFEFKNLGPVGEAKGEKEEEPSAGSEDELEELDIEEPEEEIPVSSEEETLRIPPESASSESVEESQIEAPTPGLDEELDLDLNEDSPPALDSDLDSELDFEDLDFEAAPDVEILTTDSAPPKLSEIKARGRRPQKNEFPENIEVTERPQEEPPGANFPVPELRPLGSVDDYGPSAGNIQSHDLETDEGIPLIGQVNQLLKEAVEGDYAGVEFDVEPSQAIVSFYDEQGRKKEERNLDREMAQKHVNRIKVMARLEPWRRQQAQKGKCLVYSGGKTLQMLVDQEPGPEGHEMLTLYFLSE